MALPEWITIGELAERSGVATSALRFYEAQGLITSRRTGGNQRRFRRGTLRRVSIIKAAQAVGLSLEDVAAALDGLPHDKDPTARDWQRLSRAWRGQLDLRIAALERLRGDLAECIGCGCLSLQRCALFNQGDMAQKLGPGPRYLLGDTSAEARAANSDDA
jgi:MerR family redox-sensitive transcriptional activator SoxR